MIDADLLPHQIDILTAATTTDTYGNVVFDWVTATSRTVTAYVRPMSTSLRPSGNEYVDAGRDISELAWQAHTNDREVTAFDRVRFDGVIYEVDGQPLTWDLAPDGEIGHTKLLLRRVDG